MSNKHLAAHTKFSLEGRAEWIKMQVTSNIWPGVACINFFKSIDNRLELKEIPVHGTSKVKIKNSNKTHSLEKNFKWPIALAFSYFAHAPGRIEGQTL